QPALRRGHHETDEREVVADVLLVPSAAAALGALAEVERERLLHVREGERREEHQDEVAAERRRGERLAERGESPPARAGARAPAATAAAAGGTPTGGGRAGARRGRSRARRGRDA